jgi:copper(I)-binding protein
MTMEYYAGIDVSLEQSIACIVDASGRIIREAKVPSAPAPGSAHQVVVGKLKIGHPWVREAAEGAPGTYSCIIEIQNDGDEPERLLGGAIEGTGTGVLYKLTENNGHFTSRPFEEGLVIKPHGSIELPPTAYQFKFGKITNALVADTMVNGTLVFEKLHSVPIEFMVEQDDTGAKGRPDFGRGRETLATHNEMDPTCAAGIGPQNQSRTLHSMKPNSHGGDVRASMKSGRVQVMHHKLAHGAWVFVGDGKKALFLVNEGDEKFPNLRRLAVEEHKDPRHANRAATL